MRIAIPGEVKEHEYRVAITPAGVHELTVRGHEVYVESEAGLGSAITDDDYLAAGAKVIAGPVAIAVGLGAEVTLLDLNVDRLRAADRRYRGRVRTVVSNDYELKRAVLDADLVIGAVLVPGAKAPTLIGNTLVGRMKPGAVLVDISIDQGGCFAGSRPTTHAEPTYQVHDTTFYCVANMPGAVPRTSTFALTNVTLPYVTAIAGKGRRQAMRDEPALAAGLNAHAGRLTNAAVAAAHDLPHADIAQEVLA